MAYDEVLAERVRDVLGDIEGLTTRKMFGGMAYMINGNMACGVVDDTVMLRLGNEGAEEALKADHVTPMDFTGRPMRSMVYLHEEGYADDTALEEWVAKAVQFAEGLPRK